MAGEFKIVYTGSLMPGTDKGAFIGGFVSRFGISEAEAEALANADREVVMKRGLNADDAAKYKKVLQKLGMEVIVEQMDPAVGRQALESSKTPAADEGADQANTGELCPNCGSARIDEGNCLDCGIVISKYLAHQAESSAQQQESDPANPYQAPTANVAQDRELGDLHGPGSVPAGNGWRWITKGFGLFRQNPVAWILALVVWIVILLILSMVPLVGSLATTLLSPVIGAGFMIGCSAQDRGEDFTVSHLFSGFQQNFGQLVLVGVLYLVGAVVIMMDVFSVVGAEMMTLQDPAAGAAVMPDYTFFMLPVSIAFMLFIPLFMAYWFAPALVALDGLSAVAAMKLSFLGALKNVLPFLVYGLASLVLGVLAAIPVFLGFLVLIPVITASIYVAYRDIYFD